MYPQKKSAPAKRKALEEEDGSSGEDDGLGDLSDDNDFLDTLGDGTVTCSRLAARAEPWDLLRGRSHEALPLGTCLASL